MRKSILVFGLIVLMTISMASAKKEKINWITWTDIGDTTLQGSNTKLLSCSGEKCTGYTATKDIRLRYDEINPLNEKMKGEIIINKGNDYIKVEFTAVPFGNDYNALVTYKDCKVTEKIGKKKVVYDNSKLPDTDYSGMRFSNFRTRGDGYCVNFGVLDGDDYQAFCVN